MPKRILEGKVVSNKMDKTATVLVERRLMHPMYKKYVKRTDKYAAHDELNQAMEGDIVQIQECRPISKRKTWVIISGTTGVSAPTPVSKVSAPKAEKVKAEKPKTEKTAPKAAAKKETKEKKKA
jgi:small subunit ribosomal protein S17